MNILILSGSPRKGVNTIGVLASMVMEKAIADTILSSKISDEEYLRGVKR